MARKALKKLVEDTEIKNQVENDNEEVLDEDSASAATLHPKSGSESDGDEDKSVEPSHFQLISQAMGALANVDKETLKYFNDMLSTHTAGELGKNIDGSWADKNKNSLNMKPSDAVGGAGSSHGEVDSGSPQSVKPGHSYSVKEAIKTEVSNMLGEEEGLTPEFKNKAAVIFEASLEARVAEETAKLQDQFSEALEQEVADITEQLEEKVETYIEYVAEEWMKTNEVAIESALRSEITSEFMTKLRDLFIESNINIPEDQVDVVDTLASKVEELESRLAESIQENAELRKVKELVDREEVIADASDGLTMLDAEKLHRLAEGVEAEDMEEFTNKVTLLRENLHTVSRKSNISDDIEEVDESNKVLLGEDTDSKTNGKVNPQMQRYLRAIEGSDPDRANRSN